LVTDTLISILIALFYGAIQEYFFKSFYGIKSFTEGALFFGIMRLIYYFVIFGVIYYWLNNKLQMDNKLMKLVILNCGLYVFISLLYGFVLRPETKELFTNPLFFILVISTALSPVVLNLIPYFKRLINTI
jgi:H+/Cl- antiporter ClcA